MESNPSQQLGKGLHYPGLNELRALAALSVIPGHVEQMKQLFGHPWSMWFPIPGFFGVNLFFALSGFLITSLLMEEKSRSGSVGLKRFYFKRMLRIWPLYFFVVGLSVFVLNRIPALQMPQLSTALYDNLTLGSSVLLLFILPQYLSFIVPYASQIWSVGVEEQFYLVQPFAIKVVGRVSVLMGVMLGFVFLREIILGVGWFLHTPVSVVVQYQTQRLAYIAIGCLGAMACRHYPEFIRRALFHPLSQALALMAVPAFVIAIQVTGNPLVVDPRFHSVAFTVIIVNAALNPAGFCTLNNRVLDYLGRISYGIYMYHLICIGLAFFILKGVADGWRYNILLYILTFALTLSVAAFSFKTFEGYFLKLKDRLPP